MIRRHGFAIVVAATTAIVFLAAIAIVTAAAPEGPYRRPAPPPPVGAFRDGGVPARDRAIEHVLAVELPRLFERNAHRVTLLAGLRADPAFARHGAALETSWRAMLDAVERWFFEDTGGTRFTAITHEVGARIEVVSDQLAAANLGYYLDPQITGNGRRHDGIYTYRIDEVAFVRANAERVRVLGVRRLDRLDDGIARLGMMADELDDPVVLLDKVDDKVTAQILPVLVGAPYPLGDGWSRSTRGRDIAYAAGAAIRRELMTALGSDVTSAPLAAARCRALVTASVRHHEAQHALDRDRALPYPRALAAAINERANSQFALRARHELSGYLSQIASDVWMPQWVLWNVARHGFRRSHRRVEEAYVAAVIIEGLARRLRIPSPGPVVTKGVIDRARLAALVEPLAARSTTELRSAAAALWTELFEEKLPRIVD